MKVRTVITRFFTFTLLFVLVFSCFGSFLPPPLGFEVETVKAAASFPKPLLFIYSENVDFGTYERNWDPRKFFICDIVSESTVDYTSLSSYKVVYFSNTIFDPNAGFDWTALLGNLTSGQFVVAVYRKTSETILKKLGWTIGTTLMTLSGTVDIVFNGSSSRIGWLSGYRGFSGIADVPWYYLTSFTNTTPYETMAFYTNATFEYPAMFYTTKNNVKYFLGLFREFYAPWKEVARHLINIYATDGLVYGSSKYPWLVTIKSDDTNIQNVTRFVECVKNSDMKWEFMLTMSGTPPSIVVDLVNAFKQAGLLEKWARVGMHGSSHVDYSAYTIDQWRNSVNSSLQAYLALNLTKPYVWTTPYHSLNMNGTEILMEYDFMVDIEDYDEASSDAQFLKGYDGQWYNGSLGILHVTINIQAYGTNTGNYTRYWRFWDNSLTVIGHNQIIDPNYDWYNPSLDDLFAQLNHILLIPTFSYEKLLLSTKVSDDYTTRDATISYSVDKLLITSNLTSYVKIKGTWYPSEPSNLILLGSDSYGDWTIALIRKGTNIFVKGPTKPVILLKSKTTPLTIANVSSVSFVDQRLYITLNAPTGFTSTIQVYCGKYGMPTKVSGASSWSYNSATKILTVTVQHSSDAQIEIEWIPSTLTQAIRSNYFLAIGLLSLAPVLFATAIIVGLMRGREELDIATLAGSIVLCAFLIIGTILMITILNAFIGL